MAGNRLKNFTQRITENKAREETQSIPSEGFYDPNTEFPNYEYKNRNSINRAATGQKTNEISMGGGDPNAPIDISTVRASVYPYNQVQETAAGHIIEIDDTVGSERVMIKHTSGAGVECRADGSVIISSLQNTIQVTGGNQSVIVEGNGSLVYKGNLDLRVSGDMNLSVGGDFNVEVAGEKVETLKHSSTTTIVQDEITTVKGSSTKHIEDNETKDVRGSITHNVENDFTFNVGDDYALTVNDNLTMDANSVNQAYSTGAIGGSSVDFTGNTSTCTTFYGSLSGKATFSSRADQAGTAPPGGGSGGGSQTIVGKVYSPDLDGTRTVSIGTVDVNVNSSDVPIVNYTPTTAEARSMLRSPSIRSTSSFTSNLISGNIISPKFNSSSVPNTGERYGPERSSKQGVRPIGQNPPTIDKKTFTFS